MLRDVTYNMYPFTWGFLAKLYRINKKTAIHWPLLDILKPTVEKWWMLWTVSFAGELRDSTKLLWNIERNSWWMSVQITSIRDFSISFIFVSSFNLFVSESRTCLYTPCSFYIQPWPEYQMTLPVLYRLLDVGLHSRQCKSCWKNPKKNPEIWVFLSSFTFLHK